MLHYWLFIQAPSMHNHVSCHTLRVLSLDFNRLRLHTYPQHLPYMVDDLSHIPFRPLPHHAETSRARRFTSCRHVQHYEPRFLFVAFVCDTFARRSVVPRFSLFVHISSAENWALCPNIIRFSLSIICT